VGVPLAWLLAFTTNLGVQGLLIGFNMATLLQFTMYNVYLFRTDWAARAKEVRAKVLSCVPNPEQSNHSSTRSTRSLLID